MNSLCPLSRSGHCHDGALPSEALPSGALLWQVPSQPAHWPGDYPTGHSPSGSRPFSPWDAHDPADRGGREAAGW